MSHLPNQFDQRLIEMLNKMANVGIYNAARGLSGMVGESLSVQNPGVKLIPLADIPNLLGGPEAEAVGIYLRAEGNLGGQIMLIIPYDKSMELADMIIGLPAGTTTQLGSLERSALAEMGNVTGTFFMNAVAEATGLAIRPSPPAVMVDMVGAVLDIVLATAAQLSEHVMMIQATFTCAGREVETDFWMIPDRMTLDAIAKRERGANG